MAAYLFDMLLHLSDSWGVLEPLLADAMDAVETVRDRDFRVDQRIDQDASVLVNNTDLAHCCRIVTLIHLTV